MNSLPSAHESTGTATHRRPVRTCVGCKQQVPATDLLRFVARRSEGELSSDSEFVVVLDAEHRLPGRGAWLHPDPRCVDNAERRRAFGRALRVAGSVDSSAVAGLVLEEEGDRATPVEKNRQQH